LQKSRSSVARSRRSKIDGTVSLVHALKIKALAVLKLYGFVDRKKSIGRLGRTILARTIFIGAKSVPEENLESFDLLCSLRLRRPFKKK
jgi:hypothetical protein